MGMDIGRRGSGFAIIDRLMKAVSEWIVCCWDWRVEMGTCWMVLGVLTWGEKGEFEGLKFSLKSSSLSKYSFRNR